MEAPGTAFAATWRDAGERVVSTTYGGTLCWYPIKPWRLRIARAGFEHVLRCRECPGCLEFERRRLAGRLQAKYGKTPHASSDRSGRMLNGRPEYGAGESFGFWLIRIWAPREKHAAICHRLHRRRGLQLEPGMYRLGTGSFAVLARARVGPPLYRALDGCGYRVEPIRLRRGRRAWRSLTAGVLVGREAYGEQVKRWYVRGLPPAEREKWDVVKLSAYKPYNRFRSPRAWKDGNLVLVPPQIWAASRIDRKKFMRLAAHATSPETATAIAAEVLKLAGTIGANRLLSVPAKPALSRDEVQQWYQRRVARESARTAVLSQSGSLPSPSEGRGYASSEHSSNSPPPQTAPAGPAVEVDLNDPAQRYRIDELKRRPWQELTDDERGEVLRWEREVEKRRPTKAELNAKFKAELDAWVERMTAKSKGGR